MVQSEGRYSVTPHAWQDAKGDRLRARFAEMHDDAGF